MSALIPRGASLAAALLVLASAVLPLPAGAQNVITPKWSTYLGGAGNERMKAIAQRGADGRFVVVGTTTSPDLSADAGTGSGALTHQNVFMSRFDEDGVHFHTMTFGGSDLDEPHAVAFSLDEPYDVYIVGQTRSPSITNAGTVYPSPKTGGDDAFLAKVKSDGVPEWFMRLGGSGNDVATGVALIGDAIYVTGWTTSNDFLGSNAIADGMDAFLVKVELLPTAPHPPKAGTPIPILIGGAGTDQFFGSTAEGASLLMVGTTNSLSLRGGPVLNSPHGGLDTLVGRFNTASGTVEWLAYVGGSGNDHGRAIDWSPKEQMAIAGTSSSPDFGRPLPNSLSNAFIAWLTREGTLKEVHVVGGSAEDEALSIATDTYGNAYIGGRTASTNFPRNNNSFDTTIESGGGLREGFVAAVSPPGGGGWASFIGGNAMDEVGALSIRKSDKLVIALQTSSTSGLPPPTVHDGSLNNPLEGYIMSCDVGDIVPPGAVTVKEVDLSNPNDDIDTQDSTTSISASWSMFPQSMDLKKYEWAIGTAEQYDALQAFTDVGLVTSATASLSLQPGTTYYVTVRAQDHQGLTSAARSNGVLVRDPDVPDAGMDGGTDAPDGGTDGGGAGTDGGADGGADGGSGGKDSGTDAGDENGEEEPAPPLGWGCASAGGAALPLLIGLIVLVLLGRRFGQQSRP